MVNNILRAQTVVQQEEVEYFADSENRITDMIKSNLAVSITHLLMDTLELTKERVPHAFNYTYSVEIAAIPVVEYKRLLACEQKLKGITGIVNGK